MAKLKFKTIMAELEIDRQLGIENDVDKAIRIRLHRLFLWAGTTTQGKAAAEVVNILEGNRA